MSHGSGYTVEEQVTGKVEHGGLQFDIFPVRDTKFTVRDNKTDVLLEKTKTPAELSLVAGDELRLTFLQNFERHRLPSFVTLDRPVELSNFLNKAVGSIVFDASYFPSLSSHHYEDMHHDDIHDDDMMQAEASSRSETWVTPEGLGLAGGGKV
jgi:hypothetical protein